MVRQSRLGAVGCDRVWIGRARQSWYGLIRRGSVRSGTAAKARKGLVEFGLAVVVRLV